MGTRHRSPLAAAAVAIALAPCAPLAAPKPAAPPPALSAATSPESVGFDSARLARLDTYMSSVVSEGRVVGMTTLIARHGKVVAFRTYGKQSLATGQPMTPDTLFRIYSMTKPVTGVAMMILFEEGRWRLDDPVTRYIPEFRGLKVLTGVDGLGNPILEDMKRPPTMRELMSHTAGFGYGLQTDHWVDKQFREKDVLGANGLKDMIDRTATIPLIFQPGTSWRYSSAADIQGYIVEKLSGQTFGAFLQQRIFGPLKMKDTAFYVPADKAARLSGVYAFNRETRTLEPATELYGRPMPSYLTPPTLEAGGGGLISTTMDYARFAQMLANKGELDGVRILSPAAVELMDTNVVTPEAKAASAGNGIARLGEAVGFGMDVLVVKDARAAGSLEGDKTMSWTGAAGTWFWVDPTNDIVFVGMIQRMGGYGGDDLATMSRTLTYQALVHPEK